MSKEIETNVEKFLSDNNISFAVAYVGETVKDNNWQCDQWRVKLSKGSASIEEMYYTGIGHRQWDDIGRMAIAAFKGSKKSVYYADLEKAHCKPVKPAVAGVIHSLLLDAEAENESFSIWCANLGYNEDSIKDFNLYQTCSDIGKRLRKVFTLEQMQDLRDMLQDY